MECSIPRNILRRSSTGSPVKSPTRTEEWQSGPAYHKQVHLRDETPSVGRKLVDFAWERHCFCPTKACQQGPGMHDEAAWQQVRQRKIRRVIYVSCAKRSWILSPRKKPRVFFQQITQNIHTHTHVKEHASWHLTSFCPDDDRSIQSKRRQTSTNQVVLRELINLHTHGHMQCKTFFCMKCSVQLSIAAKEAFMNIC